MDSETDASTIQSKVLQNTLAEVATRSQNEGDRPTNELCCVICLDSTTEACEARPCQHRNFHFLCLCSWLEHQTKCPLCKSDVSEVHYDFGYNGPDTWAIYTVPQVKQNAQPHAQSNSRIYRSEGSHPRPHRRLRQEAPRRSVADDEAILRRQNVYRNQLYSLHVGSNPRSGYRDISPALFEAEPQMVSRARSWLRRELQVFEFLRAQNPARASGDTMTRRRASNAEFLLEYIVAILKTVDIQGSQGQAEELLKDFLGRENTRLLLHELKNYLRSPWSLQAWDREVQYPTPRKRHAEGERGGTGYRDSAQRQRRTEDNIVNGRRWELVDSYRPIYSDHHHRQASSRSLRHDN